MNEEKFEELVNLYFDREISADEVMRLKKELVSSTMRRRKFEAYYRLHRATCSVLSNQGKKAFERTTANLVSMEHTGHRPSIVFGLGIAACLLILFLTTILINYDPVRNTNTGVAETTVSPTELYGVPTEDIRMDGDLSFQSRLAGLTLDIAPPGQQINQIETKILQQEEARFLNMIEQMNQYNVYSATPDPRFTEFNTTSYKAFNGSIDLPAGFKSSLASFE